MAIDWGLVGLAIAILFFGLSLAVLYDAVLWSDAHWDAAGLKKFRWFLIIALLGLIGGAMYWFRSRPRLEKITIRN